MSESEPAPDVVAALVAGHRDFLSFLERRVESRAVAEDILQAAFVRGIEHSAEIDPETAVAWFYRTLRNAVVDYHRRRGASARGLDRFAHALAAEEPAQELDAAICECIGKLAGTLKPEYADAIRRIEIEGEPLKDYAAKLGISAGNAAVRIHRARQALKGRLRDACRSCAEHGCLDCTCGS